MNQLEQLEQRVNDLISDYGRIQAIAEAANARAAALEVAHADLILAMQTAFPPGCATRAKLDKLEVKE
jgi:hypothetical protein